MNSHISSLPSLGLIIRKHWLELIYSGQKPWEMRKTRTNVRGRIGLIEAGSGLITGETILVDCRNALTDEEAMVYQHMHQVEDLSLIRKWRYPWVLSATRQYQKPVPYKHPKGAVIWVNLGGLK